MPAFAPARDLADHAVAPVAAPLAEVSRETPGNTYETGAPRQVGAADGTEPDDRTREARGPVEADRAAPSDGAERAGATGRAAGPPVSAERARLPSPAEVSRETPGNTYETGAPRHGGAGAPRARRDSPDERAARLAAEQWGVLDTADLRACGFSESAIAARRRNGRLRRIHPGVYAWGHDRLTLRGRFLAAVKAAGPGAVLSHRSAGVLWGLFGWDEAWLPEVTIPMRGARKIDGITIHRSRVPPEVIVLDGIPVTSPARTLLDLATVASFKPLRRAVREATAQGRVGVRDLLAVRGRRGGANLTRILADGYTPTRSELEDAVLDLLERGGFPKPDINTPIRVGGVRTVPDFRWPDRRLVVEADSREWHEHRFAQEDDADRQARLEAAGERVLRVTWKQAIVRPGQTIARIRAAW